MALRRLVGPASRSWEWGRALRAECGLGIRLAARSEVSRAAFGWAVGLAALTRVLGGPVPRDAIPAVTIALGGLLAAAAAPRFFIRGGPLEALRWVRVPAPLAVMGRVGGAVLFATAGALAVGAALAGISSVPAAALGGAAVHAFIVGTLAGAMAPALGCGAATVLGVLLVAAAGGLGESAVLPGLSAGGWLPPPGAVITAWVAGGRWSEGVGQLLVWLLLGVSGSMSVARRRGAARRPASVR